MVEIGPGLGAITLPLLARLPRAARHRDRSRRDSSPAGGQRQEPGACTSTKATCSSSILRQARATAAACASVGNLPYNISTPLLFRLIEQRQHIRDMHFMLQKEVVDRMAAAPGSRALRSADRHAGTLAARSSRCSTSDPAPSGRRRESCRRSCGSRRTQSRRAASSSRAATRNVVAAAFSQRRKTLRNALKAHR